MLKNQVDEFERFTLSEKSGDFQPLPFEYEMFWPGAKV